MKQVNDVRSAWLIPKSVVKYFSTINDKKEDISSNTDFYIDLYYGEFSEVEELIKKKVL